MSQVNFVGQKEMPVGDLKAHPNNPNRGNVSAITESLEEFSQYRSIVALTDGTILAGHHVWLAAKSIGLKTVRVDVIDTDDKTALKILLADNRLAEIGLGNDLDILLKDLEELEGDLVGIGFDDDYIKMLEEAVNGPVESEDSDQEPGGGGGNCQKLSLVVESRLAEQWDAHRKLFPDDSSAFSYLFGT